MMAHRKNLAQRAWYRVVDTLYELTHRSNTPARDTSDRTNLIGAAVGELLGTLLLVLFGLLAATHAAARGTIAGGPLDSLSVPLAFGGVLAILIIGIGPYTGANFNPAITFALWLHGQIDRRTAITYWIAQFAGGLLGTGLTLILSYRFSGASASGYGLTAPGSGVPVWVASLAEFIGMAVFQFVIAAVVAKKWSPFSTGLSIGLALGVLILVFGPISGGGFNPARTLGPMLATGNLGNLLWYLIPQLAGAWLGQWYYQRRLRYVEQP